jgi:hypothetical protein
LRAGTSQEKDVLMVEKCANSWCSATQQNHQGKLFRVEIDVASTNGHTRQETTDLWLCARCAAEMNVKVEVAGDTVRVRLSKIRDDGQLAKAACARPN